MEMETVEVQLATPLRDRLQALADRQGCGVEGLLQSAVVEYVMREEHREAFRHEALEAWQHVQRTGLHVTAEEADAWLATLESGRDVEPPACHA